LALAGFAKVLCARKCAHRWLQVHYEGMIRMSVPLERGTENEVEAK
jgi:hypothetical protein